MAKSISLLAMKDGDPPVNDKLRQEWNKYIDYLEKEKKLRGSPELDKNGLGMKLFDEYVKLHPESGLSRESIPVVRSEMKAHKEMILSQLKQGRGIYDTPNVPLMGFVDENEKSKDPNYIGQYFTKFKFPDSVTTLRVNGVPVKTEIQKSTTDPNQYQQQLNMLKRN
jgi:hypothetical protein